MPVISSPTRSWYSSNIMSRSASRIRWRITCLAVWAAMRPKLSGVTSRSSIWSRYWSSSSGVDLGLLGLAHLAGLRIDRRLLDLDLGEELLLELLGDEQLEHDEVARLAVHVHARVAGGAGLLLVGGEQGVLERLHQALGGDPLLPLEYVNRLDYLLGHALIPPSRLLRLMSEYGIETTPVSAATVISPSLTPTSSPVKLRRPP